MVHVVDIDDLHCQLQSKVQGGQEGDGQPEGVACTLLARGTDPVGAPPEEDAQAYNAWSKSNTFTNRESSR
jgi:hypothetical protein